MSAELVFESRLSYHVMRQEGAVELDPVITLQLELTGGPKIYASDSFMINHAAWSMTIQRHKPGILLPTEPPGWVNYTAGAGKSQCVIDIHQSSERFASLLDMFKGGHASEITVVVEGLADSADYSKKWDTAALERMPVQSIRFEFPLPQSEA
ncbi:hypothetical protein PO883_08570 [Massilia sp. DJPM01]|uniref:hypothetical protein n=1 Tax=Massilia sp. DJPM01 TaxID=3024404 RepID=UPI00259E13AD|nr:hypothetical protein [Massilia sp. DJPM01]MDM5177248.1 hypothetical protein [Massilia sp. DJPM01]